MKKNIGVTLLWVLSLALAFVAGLSWEEPFQKERKSVDKILNNTNKVIKATEKNIQLPLQKVLKSLTILLYSLAFMVLLTPCLWFLAQIEHAGLLLATLALCALIKKDCFSSKCFERAI